MRKLGLLCVLWGIGCLLLSVSTEKARYDGYTLSRVHIASEEQRQAVASLGLDAWTFESDIVIGENHILLPPNLNHSLAVDFHISVLDNIIDDLQELLDQQEAARMKRKAKLDSFFEDYHDYGEIVYEAKRLADAHPSIVTFLPSIGTSVQGRNIVAVTIHGGPSAIVTRSGVPSHIPKIVFLGGQHAREWIAPATAMFIYNELVSRYGTDPQVTDWLNRIAIAIVPVSNPDGYEFSWTNNRLWRKNRRPNAGGSFGVDLNRNWNAQWGTVGSSRVPSSDTYCGTGPFSEPEPRAISQFILNLGNVISAIDWHSYSQLLLRPWGYTTTPPENNNQLTAIGEGMKTAIKAVHNKDYTNQAAWQLYYTSGTSRDWFAISNITISYTVELRDTGRYGFVLPPEEIIPTGQEAWAATKVFIENSINSKL